MEEAQSSSETSFLTRAPLRNVPEDAIRDRHRRENLKSYISLTSLETQRYSASKIGFMIFRKPDNVNSQETN
jgi:hypothetical protein